MLRINDRQSPWFAADLALLREGKIGCVMLPKTESADDIAAVSAALPRGGEVLALIETARGVQNITEIAGAANVQRLAFGTVDYVLDMNLSGDQRGLIYPASQIAIASRCAGIASPVAGITLSIDDEPALLADLAFARALGYRLRSCASIRNRLRSLTVRWHRLRPNWIGRAASSKQLQGGRARRRSMARWLTGLCACRQKRFCCAPQDRDARFVRRSIKRSA